MTADPLVAEPGRPPLYNRELLSAEETRAWQHPVGWRAAFGLAAIWLQIGVGLAIYFVSPGPLTFVLAFIIVAGGQHGLGLAGHEFVHYGIVPGNRPLNDRIGIWLFCAPVGLPLPLYRYRHFAHHRTYSTPEDTKTVYRRDLRGSGLWIEIARSVTGFEYVYRAFESIDRDRRDQAAGRNVPGPRETLPPIALAQIVIFGLFSLANPLLYFALWIAPIVTLQNLFNKFRAIMEHHPLEAERGSTDTGFYKNTPGPFVRTVTAPLWERLFLSKLNFCFHVEHHLWPQVSYQYLPRVRERLLAAGVFDDPRFGYENSYASTIVKLWREPKP